MDGRTAAGIMGRHITTESIRHFVAGGMDTAGYVLTNIGGTACKRKVPYMRRGVGSKGRLGQAPK
jgi:hypothetical protein